MPRHTCRPEKEERFYEHRELKNGTPNGTRHLCTTCNWGLYGLYTSGYRESDRLTICMRADLSHAVPFVVHQCTEYQARTEPSSEQMKDLAILLKEARKPTPGFLGGGSAQPQATEEEEMVEDLARD